MERGEEVRGQSLDLVEAEVQDAQVAQHHERRERLVAERVLAEKEARERMNERRNRPIHTLANSLLLILRPVRRARRNERQSARNVRSRSHRSNSRRRTRRHARRKRSLPLFVFGRRRRVPHGYDVTRQIDPSQPTAAPDLRGNFLQAVRAHVKDFEVL